MLASAATEVYKPNSAGPAVVLTYGLACREAANEAIDKNTDVQRFSALKQKMVEAVAVAIKERKAQAIQDVGTCALHTRATHCSQLAATAYMHKQKPMYSQLVHCLICCFGIHKVCVRDAVGEQTCFKTSLPISLILAGTQNCAELQRSTPESQPGLQ